MIPPVASLVLACMIPYVAFAYLWTAFATGGDGQFWKVLGILIVARLVFSILDAGSKTVYWRLVARSRVREQLLALLRQNSMPAPHPDDHDMYDYAIRIAAERSTAQGPVEICEHLIAQMAMFESLGAVSGMRFHAAADAAFKEFRLSSGSPSKP